MPDNPLWREPGLFDWYEDAGWILIFLAGCVSGSVITGFIAWLVP